MESRYDDANAIEYHGFAKRNSTTAVQTSTSVWTVIKITKEAGTNGRVLSLRTSAPNQVFDNYLSLTYA
jgi:hypothetical protein